MREPSHQSYWDTPVEVGQYMINSTLTSKAKATCSSSKLLAPWLEYEILNK